MQHNLCAAVANLVTGEMEVMATHCALPPNENKMSDGWQDGASLRVEGGISSKVKTQSRQPFAPSFG
jgi:hypothetical protein